MKVEEIRLLQDQDKSFIVFHETNVFSRWHHHPEYELVLVTKGKGKRMVGDHIDHFEDNDLVLVGSFLPHEWLCEESYYTQQSKFCGEGIVVQFLYNFLGDQFFNVPENKNLKRILEESSRGLIFSGKTKEKIIPIMLKLCHQDSTDRMYSLFSIFGIISKSREYLPLSSPGFMEPFHTAGNEPMQKVLEYILKNFHGDIPMKTLLDISNMSNTAFCSLFKKTYRMTFKSYLLQTRVGYSCRLLGNERFNISEIAYQSGFENLSNFNRQFKKIKGLTPSQYQSKLLSGNTVD
jgi:AraC-like DNA-binding protein